MLERSLLCSEINPWTSPGYVDPLQSLSDVLAQLDAVVSFSVASVSAPVPYVRPRLLAADGRRLELQQARHPCLESDADTAFIPNDISFIQGEQSFYIITGTRTCTVLLFDAFQRRLQPLIHPF